jgi:hypothetical protein
MPGIGNDAAARIWFKTVTERLTGTAYGTLTFAQARAEAIAAALDLYPDDESIAASVEDAFAAANIGLAHAAPPRVQVLFEDLRHGDWIEGHISNKYARRQIFPAGQTVFPQVGVHNTADTSVTWSVGGPSLFNTNGDDILLSAGGVINADGSWTAPNQLGWFALTATSNADPLQLAEGRVLLLDLDTDMDLQVDALDMGGIAFSWYLSADLSFAHSVQHAPWVDDEDVFFFADAMRAAWPAQ